MIIHNFLEEFFFISSRMGVRPPHWLKLVFIAGLLIGILHGDVSSDKLIKRSKRSLEDDIGDALYDESQQRIVKREEIPVPTHNKDSENEAESNEETDSAPLVGQKKKDVKSVESANKRHLHKMKLTSAQNDVVMVKDEQTKDEEKAEEDASLRSGMHSNLDHPFTNSELTKHFDPEDDVTNGEMMGVDEPQQKRRRDTIQKTEDEKLLTLTDNVIDLLQSDRDATFANTKRDFIISRLNSAVSERSKRESEHAVADTHDMQDGGAPSHFQVDDKSADLEINANSAGVKVKAKPASLQVVSRPGSHGQGGGHHEMEMFHEPMMHYHHPHHHHHHHGHGHHHRRHYRPHHEEYDDYEEEHHEMPHFFDVPHYGSTWGHGIGGGGYGGDEMGGGYGFEHGIGRSRFPTPLLPNREENGYGRSAIESALDRRLGSVASLSGFNRELALPDSEMLLMARLRARLDDERAKERLSQFDQIPESTLTARLANRIRALESRYDELLPERRSPLHPNRLYHDNRISSRFDDNLDDSPIPLSHEHAHYHGNRDSEYRESHHDFKKRDQFARRHSRKEDHIHYR